MKALVVDKWFSMIVAALTIAGFFIFSSASLGLLTRGGAEYADIAFNQTVLGLAFGVLALIVTSRVHYRQWRKHALVFFVATIILNILVFIPGLGLSHGGAKRWLIIGGLSLQPAEFLKLGFIVYFAAWVSGIRDKVNTVRHGLLPFIISFSVCAVLLLLQRDTDSLVVACIAGLAMYFTAGGKWRHILFVVLVGILAGAVLVASRPYILERIKTFIDPSQNQQTSGYQIKQSLIAVGSGGLLGRGYGQSVQKFEYLPEPIGDSIFAVAAEEFGFVGSAILIGLYVMLAWRGLKISLRSPDLFGRLLVVGIVILVVSQSFINMAAMLGVLPLSGLPLLFVSHGGTALFVTLAEMGIVLNVSKYQRL